MDRRAALGFLAGAAALVAGAQPSEAAYGEAARVFASGPTNEKGEAAGWGSSVRSRIVRGQFWGGMPAGGAYSAGAGGTLDLVLAWSLELTQCWVPRRLRGLQERGLCAADPLQVGPRQGEGLPHHRVPVRLCFAHADSRLFHCDASESDRAGRRSFFLKG